jgi:thiamine transporter ThiT
MGYTGFMGYRVSAPPPQHLHYYSTYYYTHCIYKHFYTNTLHYHTHCIGGFVFFGAYDQALRVTRPLFE